MESKQKQIMSSEEQELLEDIKMLWSTTDLEQLIKVINKEIKRRKSVK